MEDRDPGFRGRYTAVRAVGLGFLAGALEIVGHAASLRLQLPPADLFVLGLVSMGCMGLVAGVLGLLFVPVHRLRSAEEGYDAMAIHLGLVAGLLSGIYLWQSAITVWTEGRPPAAAALAIMPIGVTGIAYFNARYWAKKLWLGAAPTLGWLPVSALVSLVLVGGSALLHPLRDTGGAYALEDDRNVVVLTVDGLRRDALGAYGGPATPHLDGMAREGVVFEDAVTPIAGALPAASSVWTGLHPLRHRALSDRHTLSMGYTSLAEVLRDEGYATGAFVSSVALAQGAGVDQGFLVYDDHPGLPVPGLTHLVPIRFGAWLAASVTPPAPAWLQRSGEATLDRFASWLDDHREVPFLAWIHLDAPRGVADAGDYAAAVQAVDAQVGRALGLLDEAGVTGETLVIVVGTWGTPLGEHGAAGDPRGLYDEVVRIPLLLYGPDVGPARIAAQVRLFDVPATALEFLGLDRMDTSESLGLLSWVNGELDRSVWLSLVGREGEDLATTPLLGLRVDGVKVIERLSDDRTTLYDLADDPGERVDAAGTQAVALEQARGMLAGERVGLETLLREPPSPLPWRAAQLDALAGLPGAR